MSMDWANEKYVRVYTRDTPEWLCLSFLAQGLFVLILRKCSRAGIIELGKVGRKGVFIAIGHGHQAKMLEPALEELLADGCVQINGTTLVVPNFLDAQETPASEAQRQRNHREKIRDNAVSRSVTPSGHEASREPEQRDGSITKRDPPVTERDETVTGGHAVSQPVTPSQPCLSEPCRTVPGQPSVPGQAGVEEFRNRLGRRLGFDGPLTWGTDEAKARETFVAHLAAVGPDVLEADCWAMSQKCRSGTPSTMSWFIRWLENLPRGARA